MNYYGQHEQEQAMQKFIHDSNQKLNWIEMNSKALLQLLADNTGSLNLKSVEIVEKVRSIKSAQGLLVKTIDEYLNKWKDFPTPVK